jgi:hypothetical protein
VTSEQHGFRKQGSVGGSESVEHVPVLLELQPAPDATRKSNPTARTPRERRPRVRSSRGFAFHAIGIIAA